MAWKRYASAIAAKKDVEFDEWMDSIRAQQEGVVPKDHVGRIARTILRKADPQKYLLSHATIVASVDTFAPNGVKVGRQMSRGVQIDVRFPDFRVTPACQGIVNNNGDAWSRPLLLSTYRSFIGSPNYVEHIQIPELSKGFIVDAIARDLGETCYVDILVATDRKHGLLVQDIMDGKLDAMSMGCLSQFTICTKCGNVASDDSQLCICIGSEGKGVKYFDNDGVEHAISELVGHVSVPNSNQFIEASWVKNPAFKGAVRRNILNPNSTAIASRIEAAAMIYDIKRDIPEVEGLKKAASTRTAEQGQGQSQDQGQSAPDPADDEADGQGDGASLDLPSSMSGGGDQGDSQSEPESQDPGGEGLTDMVDRIQKQVMDLIMKNLGDKLEPKPEDVATVLPESSSVTDGNDNLVRSSVEFNKAVRKVFSSTPAIANWAIRARKACDAGPSGVRRAGLTSRDLVILSWIMDRVASRELPSKLYKIAMSVGPSRNYPSERSFLTACTMGLGRMATDTELSFFLKAGRIASIA